MTVFKVKLRFLLALFVTIGAVGTNLQAQFPGGGGIFGGGFGSAVGGVAIDATGVVSDANIMIDPELARQLQTAIQDFQKSADINQNSELRVISLKGLEAALDEVRQNKSVMTPDLAYMAGLQRIEYVIVAPDKSDIWIAGPAEAWKLNDQGIVVGVTSGHPVIHTEDFLAAMRSSEDSRQGQGISVSIDPTEEGVKRFQQLKARGTPMHPNLKQQIEAAMGEQMISLTGIPKDSRFAQILVAADYRMKRISMGFDPSPVQGLPSVMEMLAAKQTPTASINPRFWMECNYLPVAKTEDGSVWHLRGQGVKTLTEESRFDGQGKARQTGKANPIAAKWADLMTEKFEQIAAAEPIFRELRNIMDMSVIAALIARENLLAQTNLEIPIILGTAKDTDLPSWNVPQTVATHCSFVKAANPQRPTWLVSASGGIQLDPWSVVENTETVGELSQVIEIAQTNKQHWWWDASIH